MHSILRFWRHNNTSIDDCGFCAGSCICICFLMQCCSWYNFYFCELSSLHSTLSPFLHTHYTHPQLRLIAERHFTTILKMMWGRPQYMGRFCFSTHFSGTSGLISQATELKWTYERPRTPALTFFGKRHQVHHNNIIG